MQSVFLYIVLGADRATTATSRHQTTTTTSTTTMKRQAGNGSLAARTPSAVS